MVRKAKMSIGPLSIDVGDAKKIRSREEMTKMIADTVDGLMDEYGITITELSDAAQIGRMTIHDIRSGNLSRTPGTHTLMRIMVGLNTIIEKEKKASK